MAGCPCQSQVVVVARAIVAIVRAIGCLLLIGGVHPAVVADSTEHYL